MRQEHIGKIVIDYSNPHSRVPCQPAKAEEVVFRNDASYLMVGGLGGLGQSLIKWMLAHGARHFVFLSRSGNKDGSASDTLKVIHDAEGSAIIVEGSVIKMQDCLKAIDVSCSPTKNFTRQSQLTTTTAGRHTPSQRRHPCCHGPKGKH